MPNVYVEPPEAESRLASLGLEEKPLLAAVAGGQLAVDNCTDNHPPMFPGLAGWAETMRYVRDYLVPQGWWNSDDHNYSRVIDGAGRVAIAVATGNEDTGIARGNPTNKAAKGLYTAVAVGVNAAQMDMFQELKDEALATEGRREVDAQCTTWILLIHRAPNEIRAELSLPVAIGQDGKVTEWKDRIILSSIPRDPDPLRRIEPPVQPDLDVQVMRRKKS